MAVVWTSSRFPTTGITESIGLFGSMPTSCPGLLQVSEMDNIGGSNILAVDDDPVLSDLMRRKMMIEGFEVQIRNSGKAALELLAQTQGEGDGSIRPVEMVLLDVEMPVKDGIQTLKELRKSPRYSDIPVIMVTSRTGAKHRKMAAEAGCNGYMGKPFNFPLLVQDINKLTGRQLQLS